MICLDTIMSRPVTRSQTKRLAAQMEQQSLQPQEIKTKRQRRDTDNKTSDDDAKDAWVDLTLERIQHLVNVSKLHNDTFVPSAALRQALIDYAEKLDAWMDRQYLVSAYDENVCNQFDTLKPARVAVLKHIGQLDVPSCFIDTLLVLACTMRSLKFKDLIHIYQQSGVSQEVIRLMNICFTNQPVLKAVEHLSH